MLDKDLLSQITDQDTFFLLSFYRIIVRLHEGIAFVTFRDLNDVVQYCDNI